eukprot:GHRQ01036096.1.p3 GENE.GHRQ01036096.1~~GHRQ01036096.1.p3  ORF type:complete len:113 (+),score=15.84 GHRQ01036096.1:181-519(+)
MSSLPKVYVVSVVSMHNLLVHILSYVLRLTNTAADSVPCTTAALRSGLHQRIAQLAASSVFPNKALLRPTAQLASCLPSTHACLSALCDPCFKDQSTAQQQQHLRASGPVES